LSAGAREDEKAAWANFGMEAAQNIKTAADTGLTVTSMMGGRGVMIAYQGVTGYVDGGPVEAVSRAAFFYSTPTAVAADAFKGYREGGWKGAAKNAAFTFISSKAFEYGAKKLGGATGQNTAKSKPTVKEQFAQAEFKQARQDGESLAKAFSRAQGELDRLGENRGVGSPDRQPAKSRAGSGRFSQLQPSREKFSEIQGGLPQPESLQCAYEGQPLGSGGEIPSGDAAPWMEQAGTEGIP